MSKHYIGIALICLFSLIISIMGFRLTGSPFSQRGINYDQTRVTDFRNLSYKVENYYASNKKLPTSLSELKLTSYDKTTDPETKKTYEYKVVSETSYEFCTDFSTDSAELREGNMRTPYYGEEKIHKKGYDCIKYDLPSYLKNL